MWVMEVHGRLNMVSIEWINDESRSRPCRPPYDDGPVYSAAAWQTVLACITEYVNKYLGGKPKTAIYRLQMLAIALR